MEIGIEAADKSFVVGAESGDDGRQAGFDLLGLLGEKGVIEQHDGGKREGLGREKFDTLLDGVVQDPKFVALQDGDQAASAAFYSDRKENVVDAGFESVLAIAGGLRCVSPRV